MYIYQSPHMSVYIYICMYIHVYVYHRHGHQYIDVLYMSLEIMDTLIFLYFGPKGQGITSILPRSQGTPFWGPAGECLCKAAHVYVARNPDMAQEFWQRFCKTCSLEGPKLPTAMHLPPNSLRIALNQSFFAPYLGVKGVWLGTVLGSNNL